MKGDIILKVIIGFLIPAILLYSSLLLFSYKDLGFLSILQISIYLMISYLLFFLRFGKINIKKILPLNFFIDTIMICFLIFILMFSFELLEINFGF